ncbi:MAG: hypothetical protein EOM37_10450 [Proteobacteria bacterium]|nr:hypothetical protein [Pseudomonadota bacterium]
MLNALREKIAAGVYGPQRSSNLDSATLEIAPTSPAILSAPQSPRALSVVTSPACTALNDFGVALRNICDVEEATKVMRELAGKRTGFDIETSKSAAFLHNPQAGLEPHLSGIRLVQLYGGGEEVYVIDVSRTGTACLEELKDIQLSAHNALFEMRHLHHVGVDLPFIDCTMLQHNALENTRSSLADLAKHYLGYTLNKESQTSDWGAPELSQNQLEYAGLDAVVAFNLFEHLDADIRTREREGLYSLLRKAQLPVALMSYDGIRLDTTRHQTMLDVLRNKFAAAKAKVEENFGSKFNPNSPEQIAQWLMKRLSPLERYRWPKTETGRLTTDQHALSKLLPDPSVRILLEYKQLHKLITSFGDKLLTHCNPLTGRIHPDFMICGAITGRMSCSNPNMQNLPRDPIYRGLFAAPAGRAIVCADYSQMETRVAAELSQDPKMLEIYRQGEDLHMRTAMAITGKKSESITKEDRQAAKAANFGLLYGQGFKGFRKYAQDSYGINLSPNEAKQVLTTFFREYSGLRAWQEACQNEASSTLICHTRTGRYFSLREGAWYSPSLNYPVQGAASEVLYAALGRLPEALTGYDAKIVNCVHDEILLEVSQDYASAVKAILEQVMTQGFLDVFPEAPTAGLVDAKCGATWAEAK